MVNDTGDPVVRDLLMKKSGKALTFLAGELLKTDVGERVPTFSQFSEQSEFSRGTLQNAMNGLVNMGAIGLKKQGHLGTFLVEKDIPMLLKCLGVTYISGIMPLPYTKKYEGLATGLLQSINQSSGISVDLAYMRGSQKRIQLVVNGKYDYAVTSRLAAMTAIEENYGVEIVTDFGPRTYLTGQSIVFRDKNAAGITDGMRVGIDMLSLDHARLTYMAVGDADVELVNTNYSQIVRLLRENEIDAAVWNLDSILESHPDINYIKLEYNDDDESSAVIVVHKENTTIKSILNTYLDTEAVLRIQQEIVEGKRYPNY